MSHPGPHTLGQSGGRRPAAPAAAPSGWRRGPAPAAGGAGRPGAGRCGSGKRPVGIQVANQFPCKLPTAPYAAGGTEPATREGAATQCAPRPTHPPTWLRPAGLRSRLPRGCASSAAPPRSHRWPAPVASRQPAGMPAGIRPEAWATAGRGRGRGAARQAGGHPRIAGAAALLPQTSFWGSADLQECHAGRRLVFSSIHQYSTGPTLAWELPDCCSTKGSSSRWWGSSSNTSCTAAQQAQHSSAQHLTASHASYESVTSAQHGTAAHDA